MPDFGIFRGFNDKLFGEKLYAGQLPTQLGLIGSQEVFNFKFLLNDYPNAAAAYSLRKLRKEYTGSAIKVRRASDNTEQDIGFVNNELQVADLQNFCIGTDGFVTTWYDQSGNGFDATQTTAANQPQIVSSGSVNTYLGKNAIKFNGTSNFLNLSTTLTENVAIISAHEDGTQPSGGSIHKPLFASTTNPYGASADGYALGKLREGANGASLYPASIDASVKEIVSFYSKANAKELLYGECNNGNFELFKNNSSLASNTYTPRTTGFNGNYTIGAQTGDSSRRFMGNLYEMIVYNTNQSSNRTGISDNINDFYSIY
jgi:hypothetical protein